MARTVNYDNRAVKIKEQLDDLVKELTNRSIYRPAKQEKIALADVDFDALDLVTLIRVQARVSRLILDKSKKSE